MPRGWNGAASFTEGLSGVGRLMQVARAFRNIPYITLVNLLADKELFPEFVTDGDASEDILGHLRRWLTDEPVRQALKAELRMLLAQVGQPGACARAADFIVQTLGEKGQTRLAA